MRVCPRCRSIYSVVVEHCGIDGSRLVDQEHDPLVGTTVDRYRILERIAEGGMGVVYRASHSVLRYEYAIKVLYGNIASNQTFVERLRREAEAASTIRHPYIVQVADFGTAAGLTFLVMELVTGRRLDRVIAEEAPFPPARAAGIARQIAQGLGEAHRLEFVHRDVKPSNIMLTEDVPGIESVKILDFGVVRSSAMPEDTRLTGVGHLIGTPTYMAPEQGDDAAVTPAADIYALGVMLYEMLTGEPPFTAERPTELIVKHIHEAPPALPPLGGLEEVVRWTLEKSPANRPSSAEALIRALDALDLSGLAALPKRPAPAAHDPFLDDSQEFPLVKPVNTDQIAVVSADLLSADTGPETPAAVDPDMEETPHNLSLSDLPADLRDLLARAPTTQPPGPPMPRLNSGMFEDRTDRREAAATQVEEMSFDSVSLPPPELALDVAPLLPPSALADSGVERQSEIVTQVDHIDESAFLAAAAAGQNLAKLDPLPPLGPDLPLDSEPSKRAPAPRLTLDGSAARSTAYEVIRGQDRGQDRAQDRGQDRKPFEDEEIDDTVDAQAARRRPAIDPGIAKRKRRRSSRIKAIAILVVAGAVTIASALLLTSYFMGADPAPLRLRGERVDSELGGSPAATSTVTLDALEQSLARAMSERGLIDADLADVGAAVSAARDRLRGARNEPEKRAAIAQLIDVINNARIGMRVLRVKLDRIAPQLAKLRAQKPERAKEHDVQFESLTNLVNSGLTSDECEEVALQIYALEKAVLGSLGL